MNTSRPKLRRLDIARMVNEKPPPVPWRISDGDGGGLVVDAGVTMLNGREGEGKSALSIALGAGVATGQSVAGYSCRKGGVLILDAENGEAEIHRRIHAFGLPAEIEVYEVEQFELRRDLDQLEQLIVLHKPALVILDSWRTLWTGDENDSGQVTSALGPLGPMAHRHRIGILVLHHSNRSTGDYRGNSAIGGCVEIGYKLAREGDDPDEDRRYLHCWKCRPAPKPARQWIRISTEGGAVFIEAAEPPAGQDRAARAPVRADLAPQVRALLTSKPQTQAAIARALGRDAKDQTIRRILVGLDEQGHAGRQSGGWVSSVGPPIEPRHPDTLDEKAPASRENGGVNAPDLQLSLADFNGTSS